MSLKFSTSGRPMIECINPECRKLHAIHRRGDYVQRTQVRVSCRSCGTKWQLNAEDQDKLKQHYEQRQQELEAKNREKNQKNQEKTMKNEPPAKNSTSQKPTKKTEQSKNNLPQKKQKNWLEQILS